MVSYTVADIPVLHSLNRLTDYHSSHICAVYPRYFVNLATIRTFASSNDKNEDGNRKITIAPLAG